MPKSRPFSDAQKPPPEALARWDNEGGADPCGPQVPGVAKDCGEASADNPANAAVKRQPVRDPVPKAAAAKGKAPTRRGSPIG